MPETLARFSEAFPMLAAFTADTRLYELDAPWGAEQLLVESWVGRDALSELYEWHVTCISTDIHIELKSLLAQQVTLKTRLADGTWSHRSGWVSQAAQLGADGGLARYRITLVPWLWLATQRRTSRVFQDKTVLQIVEEVLSADAPRNNWRATPDAENYLAQARARSYCCQYRETDYAFLTRILAEEGIGFTFEEDSGEHASGHPSHQRLVLFADSPSAFVEDACSAHSAGIRFHRDAAVEEQDTIQKLGCECISQPEITTISGWDYKTKRVISASMPTAHPADNDAPPFIETCDWLGLYPFANQYEAERCVRMLREAMDARTKTWFGDGTVRSFRAGTVFDLLDAPVTREGDPKRLALLGVLHAGVNNLPADLKQNLDARLGPHPAYAQGDTDDSNRDGFTLFDASKYLPDLMPDFAQPAWNSAADHIACAAWDDLLTQANQNGYAMRFTAIAADVPWRPALVDGTGLRINPKPTALGSQTAIVVGEDGTTARSGEVCTDHLGRIRIRFHWQEQESNTCWVRVMQMFAGPGYGAQFIPRIGQEVLVKFFENDIDRPVVNGVLYNGQGDDDVASFTDAADHRTAGQNNKIGAGHSPAWHGAAGGEHHHAGFLSGFKSVALGADGYTKQANWLVFDDTTGRLRAQLGSDTAASHLTLGHLIHQADNYRGSYRGTGWELRTDAYGAIRAGRGLLISTYYGTAPGGKFEPAGDNAAGVALLKQAQQFADTFNQAAQVHQTVNLQASQGSKTLNQDSSQSVLNDELPPLAAMLKAASGQVGALDPGQQEGEQIPHSSEPLLTIAAQAGLAMTAADGLHIASGETAHFAAGRDVNLAVGETLTMHSGQAIGMLAGAVAPGEGNAGIKLYAGQGDVELQAQSDEMTFAAKELVRLISANSHVDFAAAKSITLATAGGASLTIEGGNITFACPGTISIKAASKSFTGPTRMSYPLPVMPRSICVACLKKSLTSAPAFTMIE